jgi:hypothetical protein
MGAQQKHVGFGDPDLPGLLRIPLGVRPELRLFYRPGRWMTAPQCERLVGELRAVTAACHGGRPLSYGVLSGSEERLAGAVIAVLRDRRSRRALGFNAMSLLPIDAARGRTEHVLHSGLCMVVPGLQGRGLTRLLVSLPPVLAFARGGFRPLWVTNVSQVPAAIGVFGEAVARLHPTPDGDQPPTSEHLRVAEQLLSRHRAAFGVGADAEFDARLFVIRNAYTGGSDDLKKSWASAPLHRDARWNRLCRDRLDYDRGDDLLQVGRLTLGHAFHVFAGFLARALKHPRGRGRSASHFSPKEARA